MTASIPVLIGLTAGAEKREGKTAGGLTPPAANRGAAGAACVVRDCYYSKSFASRQMFLRGAKDFFVFFAGLAAR